MTTLKELTWESHQKAEQTEIMQQLLSNQITNRMYCNLVYTKYLVFAQLENRIDFVTPCLHRAQCALNDWQQMQCSLPKCVPSLETYLELLRKLDSHFVWAHVYVHYLAPLYGGQIIKKVIQHRFPTSMYEFDDPMNAIAEVRSKVNLEMAEQANLAFDYTTKFLNELYLEEN